MLLENNIRTGRNGFIYIPLHRSRELLIVTSVFLLITLILFSLLGIWWIVVINVLALGYLILHNTVHIINKDKALYRKSNTLGIFPGSWKPLTEIQFISIFPVSFRTESFGRPDIYRMRTEFSMNPAEREYLSEEDDKQIHVYFVTKGRQKLPVARYRNRKSALLNARILSAETGLPLWNAMNRDACWDNNNSKMN